MAGVQMLEQIFTYCQKKFHCARDPDFPKVILISYPFTEMLEGEFDPKQINKELRECLDSLRSQGATLLAIACNTIHLFLDNPIPSDLAHLPLLVKKAVGDEVPLVLCTTTSARFRLHEQFFPCTYPDLEMQKRVGLLIDRILDGEDGQEELEAIIQSCEASTIVLGCTELSLVKLKDMNKKIIDPMRLASVYLCESWKNNYDSHP